MSAEGLARFASSVEGQTYARVCEAWGVDPAAPLLAYDDVLAQDFRTALLLTRPKPEPEVPVDDREGVVTDLEEQMKALEARFVLSIGAFLGGLSGGTIGASVVQLVLDSKRFDAGLAQSQGKLAASNAKMTGSVSKFSSTAALGYAAVGLAAVAFASKAVNAASDQEEALNKVKVVFGSAAGAVESFAATSATAFGISKTAALGAAAGFGTMLDTAGFTAQAAADMSVDLVKLSADLASFNNIDPTEALEKLRSGLAGEAEPLRQLGILLSEARVKENAYATGIAKTGEELTEGQKVQARYNLILEDSGKAQGDFERTSGSLANQQRILAAQLEDLAATLGKVLLPAVNVVVGVINAAIGPVAAFAEAFSTAEYHAHAFTKALAATAPAGETAASVIDDVREASVRAGDSAFEFQNHLHGLAFEMQRNQEAADAMASRQEFAQYQFEHTGQAATGAGVRIRRFANLSQKEINEWRKATVDDLRAASLKIGGLGEDWRQTANQTIRAARRMARDAEEIANNLDKLADIRAPDTFKKWLVEQGPGWVSGYVDATKAGKESIEGYWRDASASVRSQKDALDDVIGKVQTLDGKIKNLPTSKDIQINVHINATGGGPTVGDEQIADALANELVKGQT